MVKVNKSQRWTSPRKSPAKSVASSKSPARLKSPARSKSPVKSKPLAKPKSPKSTPSKKSVASHASASSDFEFNSLTTPSSTSTKLKKTPTKRSSQSSKHIILRKKRMKFEPGNCPKIAVEKQKQLELENTMNDLKRRLAEDANNIELQAETLTAERNFRQSLFVITKRTGPTIKWPAWTEGYMQMISLSDYGREYMKTGMYFMYH